LGFSFPNPICVLLFLFSFSHENFPSILFTAGAYYT
jgi:hypothetical protein